MVPQVALRGITVGLLLFASAATAHAQSPTIEPGDVQAPGSTSTTLGPSPGASGNPLGDTPGGQDSILGGRPGASSPRVPSSVARPGERGADLPERRGIIGPTRLSPMTLPLYGPLDLPAEADEGPSDGLTLDAAIERLVRANLDLRSKAHELPKAEADILTASLRANPILYADSQYVPYGSFSDERPGGPTQYDVNISYPLDITGKRKARTVVAEQAKCVLEAQYQDAVRVQIDNLYTAFVDVLAAREAIRYSDASIAGLEGLLEKTQALQMQQTKTRADVNQIQVQLDAAEIERMEAEEALTDAKRSLAVLLNIPRSEAAAIGLRGSIREPSMTPPPVEELLSLALQSRPDIAAFRLGTKRAQAEVRLAEANRLSDVYLLYQPYTFQNNSSFDEKNSHSWALGVTVPLPIFNRNQGNIERARVTVSQTRTQLAEIEQRVLAEVEQAARQYTVTRASVERIERSLLPNSMQIRDAATLRFTEGEADSFELLNAQRSYNDVVRQYRDVLIRHRRSSLRLNTVVGRRILP